MNTTVIYHSADFDGIFCREIARKFLPDAELIGWDFADAPLPIPDCERLIVMDLPLDRPFGFKWEKEIHDWRFFPGEVVWIDHHKSSIETHPNEIPGYRIDGVAACRLAWQWFSGFVNSFGNDVPQLEDYKERRVSEPLAVRLAGEYDIWDKRDTRAETFQYGLRLVDPGSDFWEALLCNDGPDGVGEKAVEDTLGHGQIIQRYEARTQASTCKARSFLMDWEGLNLLCINSARFNSLFFASRDIPETGHDALLGFCWNGKCWTVSLYHAKHRTDIDLSQIAIKHGGGGHKGACGFTAQTLPFSLNP